MKIAQIAGKVLSGGSLSLSEAAFLAAVEGTGIFDFFASAAKVRKKFKKNRIGLCSIVNAKSGLCSEDCSYCAQSSRSSANIPVYSLVDDEAIIGKAIEAKKAGVKRFCIVTSGKKAGRRELTKIASVVQKIRKLGLFPCATLGLLKRDELELLRDSGLERYHHNLETSERFFASICSTHSYLEKVKTIKAAKSAGLSICSGGLFGLGEKWRDRIDMAFALKELQADSIPVNFLIPVKGTPMEGANLLHPFEALKIISLYRFIFPDKEVRVCGGRKQALGEFNSMVFAAGADSLLTGNYLTATGTPYDADLGLIESYGLKVD